LALEARIDNLDIVEPLSKFKRDLYSLKVSINGGKALIDIFFKMSYINKMKMIVIEVRRSESNYNTCQIINILNIKILNI